MNTNTTKWEVLKTRFIQAHEKTGVSVKQWCDKNKLNYNTARRHIKVDNKSTSILKNKSSLISPVKSIRVASIGNQNARKLGHYSEFITTDEDILRHSTALIASLHEELALLRMQMSNLLVGIKVIEAKFDDGLSFENEILLYEKYVKLQNSFDVKIARIESLENSLIQHKKIAVDMEKTSAVTEKLKLETEKLNGNLNGANQSLAQIYADILALDDDGMMNGGGN